MSGETPTNTGFDPQTITGDGGVSVSGAGHVHISLGGPGGAGGVIQEVFIGSPEERPVTVTQAAPGGPFVTLLTGTITTGLQGHFLDIDATLNATVTGGGNATRVRGAMRVIVDGAIGSPEEIGASADAGGGSRATGGSVSLTFKNRVPITLPVAPARTAVHTVALQWEVLADGADPSPTISLLSATLDGAAMFVREVS